MLELQNVKKSFGQHHIIHDVSLRIEPGELIVFVGPSGCGKSTLLRMIAGLEKVSSGKIFINQKDVTEFPPYDRGLSMVFQSYALYPHMTVRENIAFGLKTMKLPRKDIDRKVEEAAQLLQLKPYLDRKPKALSGGQRQRVAIGRSIVRNPTAFLLDEPLSNLDAALRTETRIEIARLHRELGAAMIYVTHDQTEAMTLADRIVVLQSGKILQVDTPQRLYEQPSNTFVAQFIGSPKMNILPVKLQEPSGHIILPGGHIIPNPHPATETCRQLGIRPEHLTLCTPDQSMLRGTVTHTEYLGAETCLYLELPEGAPLTVRMAGKTGHESGAPVHLRFSSDNMHLFDNEGLRCSPSVQA